MKNFDVWNNLPIKGLRKNNLFFVLLIVLFCLVQCQSSEVKEDDLDDILEEELRADPEPFREIKNDKDEIKKGPRKTLKR